MAAGWGGSGQRCFLRSFCAIRAFTSFFTRAAGRGLSTGNWMVPLDVWYPFRSSWYASTRDPLPGNRLQCFENAANHISVPLYLIAGILQLMASVACGGTT